MSQPIAAMIARFQAAVALDAVAGPYLEEAVERSAFPYAVIGQIQGTDNIRSFGTIYTEQVHVQIDVYHTSAATLRTYHDAVHTLFDRQTFSVTGGTLVGCTEIGTPFLVHDPDLSPGNLHVYRSSHDFIVQVDRTR
jgi:hypothetical protein